MTHVLSQSRLKRDKQHHSPHRLQFFQAEVASSSLESWVLVFELILQVWQQPQDCHSVMMLQSAVLTGLICIAGPVPITLTCEAQPGLLELTLSGMLSRWSCGNFFCSAFGPSAWRTSSTYENSGQLRKKGPEKGAAVLQHQALEIVSGQLVELGRTAPSPWSASPSQQPSH